MANSKRRAACRPLAEARRTLVARLRPLSTGQMKAMATVKAPWQTIYRIARGITKNPHVQVLEECERIMDGPS